MIKNILSHRGIQTLLIVGLFWLFKDKFSYEVLQFFYGLSLFIKDVLLWILPFTVFFFISHTVKSFDKKASFFVILLLVFETFSNTCSCWYGYGLSHMVQVFFSNSPVLDLTQELRTFTPLFRLDISRPWWWAADKGAVLGLSIGLLSTISSFNFFKTPLERGKKVFDFLLIKVFSKTIPLFILGFVISAYKTKSLETLLLTSGKIVSVLAFGIVFYLSALLLISASFNFKKALKILSSLLPAGGIALSSGCSLSTMPWTIKGVKEHSISPNFPEGVIPATTNIQQIGDCLTNTFLCALIYSYFYGHLPSMSLWLSFSTAFVLARFATAAVIGGAVFVMLPIYESYLNFTGEMIALILAFNVLLDPLVTSSNVMANGFLCLIFEKIWIFFQGGASYKKLMPLNQNDQKELSKVG